MSAFSHFAGLLSLAGGGESEDDSYSNRLARAFYGRDYSYNFLLAYCSTIVIVRDELHPFSKL